MPESARDTDGNTYGASLLGLALAYLMVVLLGCMGASQVLAQPAPAPEAGRLYLQTGDQVLRPALHLATDVTMLVEGMVARVDVTHRFVNDSGHWQEGVYIFPLPEDSAVNRFKMVVAEREIIGEIHEREAAEKRYQAAKAEGRKAALMEQQRPNMFTQRIANIAPGETISIELSYVQAIRYEQGRFSLRFPMTITPRYTPPVAEGVAGAASSLVADTAGWALPQPAPDTAAPDTPYLPQHAQNPIRFTIQLNAGLTLDGIESQSHQIDSVPIAGSQGQYRVSLSEGQVDMDRDFQLAWWPQRGTAPLAAVFSEQVGAEHFVQLLLLPPARLSPPARQARDVRIVLDTSGSMAGNSIRQATQSVEYALSRLRPDDYFNLIEFNDAAHALFSSSQPASAQNIATALQFVRRLQANGGTNIAGALQLALAQGAGVAHGETRLQQVVFITDGSVGNEAQLFSLIDEKLGAMRLFTVGIGSAPNSFFMRKAAEVGKGSYTYVSSVEAVADSMNALFNKLESPVVTGVDIDWPDNLRVTQYPSVVPDLYLGEPVFVTARLDAALDGTGVEISGLAQGERWQRRLRPGQGARPVRAGDYTESPLASYWGRLQVAALLDQQRLGAAREEIRQAVLDVALPFQLLSPFTSFVAIEQRRSRPADAVLSGSQLANAVPEGQHLAARLARPYLQPTQLPYAATASDSGRHLLLALGAGLLLLGLSLLPGWRKSARPGAAA